MPSLPSSPYSPSPSSSSSSSSSFAAPPHHLYGPTSSSPLFAAGADGSPPLFMSLPFPMPPSPRRRCDAWSRPEVSPYLSGVPGVPPPLHLGPLPRPIPTGGIHHTPSVPRYDAAGAVGPLSGDVSVSAVAAAAAATTYASSVYAYDRSIAAVAGVTPHFDHHPSIPLSSYGPSLLWWD